MTFQFIVFTYSRPINKQFEFKEVVKRMFEKCKHFLGQMEFIAFYKQFPWQNKLIPYTLSRHCLTVNEIVWIGHLYFFRVPYRNLWLMFKLVPPSTAHQKVLQGVFVCFFWPSPIFNIKISCLLSIPCTGNWKICKVPYARRERRAERGKASRATSPPKKLGLVFMKKRQH